MHMMMFCIVPLLLCWQDGRCLPSHEGLAAWGWDGPPAHCHAASHSRGITGVAGWTAPPDIPSDRRRAADPHLVRGGAGVLKVAAIGWDPFWAATHLGSVAKLLGLTLLIFLLQALFTNPHSQRSRHFILGYKHESVLWECWASAPSRNGPVTQTSVRVLRGVEGRVKLRGGAVVMWCALICKDFNYTCFSVIGSVCAKGYWYVRDDINLVTIYMEVCVKMRNAKGNEPQCFSMACLRFMLEMTKGCKWEVLTVFLIRI